MPIQIEIESLRQGDINQQVRKLQLFLWYVTGKPSAVDGNFGPSTETAVREFQQTYSLSVTGIVRDADWQVLLNLPHA